LSLWDVLFNAAGGGVVGSLLHIGSSWFETYRKKKDAEVEIMLLNAKLAAADKEAAWRAFTESQKLGEGLRVIPEGVSGWMKNIYVGVDALRALTRPLLTWIGVILLAWVYFAATPDQQATMQDEVQFGCWTMIFWFFGARYNRPTK
jgi:hypothetical protein